MSDQRQIIVVQTAIGTVQVFRRVEGAAIVYACWTLTNDGTPIGATFEYAVEATQRDTVAEQIDINPHVFGMRTAAFVRKVWQPRICPACQSRVTIAICQDAYAIGREVPA